AEVKAASSGQLPQSFKVTSPEGLALLRQAWGEIKALFKPASPETGISPTSNAVGDPVGTSTHAGSQQAQKEKKAEQKFFKKLGEKLANFPLKEFSKAEHHFCKKWAHAIVRSHASHSSGSRNSGIRQQAANLFLTVLHGVVYCFLQYGLLWAAAMILIGSWAPGVKPLVEWPFRFTAHFAFYTFPAFVWACAQTHLAPTLVISGLLAIGFYFTWEAEKLRMSLLGAGLLYLIIQGRGWSVESAPWNKSVVSETTAVSTPMAVPETVGSLELGSSKLNPKTSNSSLRTSNLKPVVTYQPAVAFNTSASPSDSSPMMTTLYDPKLWEQEIAALPQNCIVKAYPLSPDESMPWDMAVSRLQDLIDPDKYTLMIGGARQKIISITATATNLVITYKSEDAIGGIFNSADGVLTLFWEDVLYIHSDEIDVQSKPPLVFYQCSLIGSGSKNALTFQCASADDLKHLVSTMQYFIRHSRLGHDTALAGMPYPAQGVRLNNDCVVEKLWAQSPLSRAGVGLGDMVWSVEKNGYYPPREKDLETQLASLPPGSHNLFIVSPADRGQAQKEMTVNHSNVFNPKRIKVVLITS
ncbi:MAG TPA: hypothetical protein VN963_04675, partial [bacterium]|nr:hypothetical protein [bacterium]